jgi:hypothetical protein
MTEPSERSEYRGGGRLVTIAEESEQIWQEVSRLVAAARRTGREGQAALRESLERSPYLTLAAAATGGYLLGGGLPNWALRWALDVAGRVTWMGLVQHLLDAGRAPREHAAEGESAGFQPS